MSKGDCWNIAPSESFFYSLNVKKRFIIRIIKPEKKLRIYI